MIKENIEFNERVVSNTSFINELRHKFPQFFIGEERNDIGEIIREGYFDIERFLSTLQANNPKEVQDGYHLSFVGKEYARRQTGEKSQTVIVPDNANNSLKINSNSKNLFLTGDNLEILRHLQNNYSNQIDLIYIDPPYNTGKEGFVYPDSFEYSDEVLQTTFGLNQIELDKLKSIQGKSTHSAWLTFMYPRLSLAHKLLKSTGVLFVSIDDNEYANLKLLLDEIFGEGEFIATVIWERAFSPINLKKHFSESHDYILCYAKSYEGAVNNGLPRSTAADSRYSNPDDDPRGVWQSDNFSVGPAVSSNIYTITAPSGRKILPPSGRSWLFSEERTLELISDNRVWFGASGNGVPRYKRFLSEVQSGMTPMTIWKHEEVGHSQSASQYLKRLFDGVAVFTYPKPVGLIQRLIGLYSNPDSIILDFFAGSSTTAEAVMKLNVQDNGNRKFIMAQLNELTYKINNNGEKVAVKGSEAPFGAGYMSIDEISRERIRRASKKITDEENSLDFCSFDGGFQHFYFIKPTQTTLKDLRDFDPESGMFIDNKGFQIAFSESGFDDMIKPFSAESLNLPGGAKGVDTILTTWKIRDGYKFDEEISTIPINGYDLFYIGGTRIYLINQGWSSNHTKELLNKIGRYEITVQTIVIYGYSFTLESIRELELGLKQLSSKIHLIRRY